VAGFRRRVARKPHQASAEPDGYRQWLLDELYVFVQQSYPGDALPREKFMALMKEYGHSGWLRPTNRYLGDLWYLFAPDFQRRLEEYYRYQDLNLTMTLFSYAANKELLRANYERPYQIAFERLGRFSVLELGAGIPHGLLHGVRAHGPAFCTQLTSVDIEGFPAAFVASFCERHRIRHRWIPATAGKSAVLDDAGPFDFVFAKDVFEHLVDPQVALDQLLARTSSRAVLALDLEDKGDVVYQHVSPHLAPLSARVAQAGFTTLEQTGNVTIFARN
jgi:hypothetical protein